MEDDEKSVNGWSGASDHDELVNALDPFRSRNYWEAVRVTQEFSDLSKFDWEKNSSCYKLK